MKKIPTLFERTFENHKVVNITDKVTPGCEAALDGTAYATVKIDGSCCAIIDGVLYKRYDAKKGKKPPKGAIPCSDPDPVTGHWPHWLKVDANDPANKWFLVAYQNERAIAGEELPDGTYEAFGEHFQGNPYMLTGDRLYRHGSMVVFINGSEKWTFEKIRDYLKITPIEGLVFWKDGEPICKIKRSDFGFPWPLKEEGTK